MISTTLTSYFIGNQAAQVAFWNFAPIPKCITNIDRITTDDTKDLNLVMPRYNLIDHRLINIDIFSNRILLKLIDYYF